MYKEIDGWESLYEDVSERANSAAHSIADPNSGGETSGREAGRLLGLNRIVMAMQRQHALRMVGIVERCHLPLGV